MQGLRVPPSEEARGSGRGSARPAGCGLAAEALLLAVAWALAAAVGLAQPLPPLADVERPSPQDAAAARLGWSTPTHTEATCTDVRLDAPGGPLHGHPRPMAPEGRCYAATAALLYDAWRASHGAEPPGSTSPLEAAIHYQVYSGRRWELSGGYACEALDMLAAEGGCDASRVGAALGDLRTPADLARLEACHAMLLAPEPPSSARARRITRRCGPLAALLTPGAPLPDVDALAHLATAQADLSPLAAGHLCLDADRLRAPGIPPCRLAHATGPPGQLLDELDARLDRAPAQPAGIAWCVQAATAPGAVGVDWRPLRPGEGNHLPTGLCARHFSAVIGRRWQEGRCEYLVTDDTAHLVGGGQTWVDARTLGLNTFGVYGL